MAVKKTKHLKETRLPTESWPALSSDCRTYTGPAAAGWSQRESDTSHTLTPPPPPLWLLLQALHTQTTGLKNTFHHRAVTLLNTGNIKPSKLHLHIHWATLANCTVHCKYQILIHLIYIVYFHLYLLCLHLEDDSNKFHCFFCNDSRDIVDHGTMLVCGCAGSSSSLPCDMNNNY